MLDKSVMLEYDEMLIGKRKKLPLIFFSNGTTANHRLALEIMKYSFETYLQWTPMEICDWLTMDIIKQLKLNSLLRYIIYPKELEITSDLFYMAKLLYPSSISFSQTELILYVYKRMLSSKRGKFPKEFFNGVNGIYRATVCLRYMIEHYIPFDNIPQLYQLFASPKISKLLRTYKIIGVCEDLFGTPLDFLHETLTEEQKNNGLYLYYKFKRLYVGRGGELLCGKNPRLKRV